MRQDHEGEQGDNDVMVLAVAFAFYHDGSWQSEIFKPVGCPDWGEFLNIIWQWCRKWREREATRLETRGAA